MEHSQTLLSSAKFSIQNGIALQSTGGYSSDLNGNVEIYNKVLKRGTGALLANAGLKDIFWSYAILQ